jgi:asparagine synthase (glutamine-hydrolysing)
MCGIAGFSGRYDHGLLAAMDEAMAHRGPDGAGAFFDAEAGIGLAHRRLAIIELTDFGAQPMADLEGKTVIVFNGEIYNYRELRAELIREGATFRGGSDTEVLLQLYLRHGEAMLPRLNGMFAFAIWDTQNRSLFLARDGLGVKPLYYAETGGGFLFGSELKSLLRAPDLDRSLNPQAVRDHLRRLWAPAPHTMLRAVKKLEPGMAMRVSNGAIARRWRHYDLPLRTAKPARSTEEAITAVRMGLATAVERQMVADVEVGAFLSGGLDSSTVVAFAQKTQPQRPLSCYTISLDAQAWREEGMADDLPYARQVADHLGVKLTELRVGKEMADDFADLIYHLDEPQADPAPLNVLYISRLARAQGVKVLLSGSGGDDIFSGYRRHHALLLERYWSFAPKALRGALAAGAQALPAKPAFLRRLRKAFAGAAQDREERLLSYFDWIDPSQVEGLLAPDLAVTSREDALAQSLAALPKGAEELDRMLALECRHFLADHNLNYTDKMSMAAGIEVRVPLLDPDLIDLAFQLPAGIKQRGRHGKWIFKKAMEGLLPHDVIWRPKTGFGAPVRAWLAGPLRPLMQDMLSEDALRKGGMFDAAAVQRMIVANDAGRVDASYTLFALMCIEYWRRLFVDRGAVRGSAAPARAPVSVQGLI